MPDTELNRWFREQGGNLRNALIELRREELGLTGARNFADRVLEKLFGFPHLWENPKELQKISEDHEFAVALQALGMSLLVTVIREDEREQREDLNLPERIALQLQRCLALAPWARRRSE